MGKIYTVDVQENESGEQYIEFPLEMMNEVQWKEGDNINWQDNKDGSFTLTKVVEEQKVETCWVLVECVSTFRQRYMVEVPKDHPEYALDTVTCEDAKEFSQEYLGEQIVSHRVVSKDEALMLCDSDNEYTVSWIEELKMKNFFTSWSEQDPDYQ